MAAVLLTAGIMKLSDPAALTQDILRYRMLSEGASVLLAACLPWLEILIGMALFCRPFRLTASFLTTELMAIFTLAVSIALARGLDISCGCFGKAFAEFAGSGVSFLIRDIVFLGLSGLLFSLTLRDEQRST